MFAWSANEVRADSPSSCADSEKQRLEDNLHVVVSAQELRPGELFGFEVIAGRRHRCRFVKRACRQMRLSGPPIALERDWRTAISAKRTGHAGRGRIAAQFGAVDGDLFATETGPNDRRSRRGSPAALAVAIGDEPWLANRPEADRAAQTAPCSDWVDHDGVPRPPSQRDRSNTPPRRKCEENPGLLLPGVRGPRLRMLLVRT